MPNKRVKIMLHEIQCIIAPTDETNIPRFLDIFRQYSTKQEARKTWNSAPQQRRMMQQVHQKRITNNVVFMNAQ